MALEGRACQQLQPESPGLDFRDVLGKNFCFQLELIFLPVLPLLGSQDGKAAS